MEKMKEKPKGEPRSWKYYLSITYMWGFCFLGSLGCTIVWVLLRNLTLAGIFAIAAVFNLVTLISFAFRTWHYYEIQRV